MTTIVYSSEDIGDDYAPSLNAAFAQLYAESGIRPRVLAPLGGKRTLQQALSVPGAAGRRSDHYKGRGVDIDNHRAFRNWDEDRFLEILALHGWRNVQINGDPFPKEPWHFANHATTPAGSGGIPLPAAQRSTERKDKMILFSAGGQYHILHSGGVYSITTGNADFINAIAERIGNAIPTDTAFIDALKAQYAAQNPRGAGGTLQLDDATIAKMAQAYAVALVAEQKKPGN